MFMRISNLKERHVFATASCELEFREKISQKEELWFSLLCNAYNYITSMPKALHVCNV